jgi:hypothetical protein
MIVNPLVTPPPPPLTTTQSQPTAFQQAISAPMAAANQTASATRTQTLNAVAAAGRREAAQKTNDGTRTDETVSPEARTLQQARRRRGGALDVSI